MRHYSIWPGNYVIVIPPHLRDQLQAAGRDKTKIAEYIFERARIHRREWAEAVKGAVVRDRGDSIYAALESPAQLLVVAAGGPAGGFGAIIPPWLGHKAEPPPKPSASVLTANRRKREPVVPRRRATLFPSWPDALFVVIALPRLDRGIDLGHLLTPLY